MLLITRDDFLIRTKARRERVTLKYAGVGSIGYNSDEGECPKLPVDR